jgi:UDP-N-acetylmuramoyl-L-alanyl-D-glutamate--2,6-diaminopimelate ligase
MRMAQMQQLRSNPSSVSLRRLFPTASFVGCADVAIQHTTTRSDECRPGSLFAAIPGRLHDGVSQVREAIQCGASAVLTSQPLAEVRVSQCIVSDVRRAYSEVCHALAGSPSRRLGLTGVTGTNGKTTTTWLIRSIFEARRKPTGLLGTIEYSDGLRNEPATLTTPDSKTLSDWLAAMVAAKTQHAAIELSSHALHQHRAAGVSLDVAVVTNITQDHFDYHGDAEAYREAKSQILTMVKRGGLVVLNADDSGSASLVERLAPSNRVCTVGLENPSDLHGRIIEESLVGSRFLVQHGAEQYEYFTPLIGRHNVLNCLGAIAAARHFGLTLDEIADGIATQQPVPGRLERIEGPHPFQVFVDYAHTDDALRNVIAAVRPMTRGRVIVVFGAGGDRDPGKRPLMARAAAAADQCVITSDNPRSEDPDSIIEQIRVGFVDRSTPCHVEPDRETAIAWAIRNARPGDTLLVCGKGHERHQVVGDERIPFDDAAACRQHLFHYRIPRRAAS